MNDLSEVKVGDLLAYRGTWGETGLTKVEKVTKTLVVCKAGRFSRASGWEYGTHASYSRSRVWVPNDADRLTVRISQAQRVVEKLKVGEDNLAAVEAFLAAIKPAPGSLKDAAK